MGHRVVDPEQLDWITRPHEPGQPARHVRELSEIAGFAQLRANVWRYEPGSVGRRHRHPTQEETFLVLGGTLSLYVEEPPVRCDLTVGQLIRVDPGTPLQAANHGTTDLVVLAVGHPPEEATAELLPAAA